MPDLILHDYAFSANCYKIRLAASLLGLTLKDRVEYDVLKGETRTPEYLSKVNANGRIPVLQIGDDTFLPESGAACHYLADGTDLIPTDRLQHAQVLQWMFFEQYSFEPYAGTLRFWLAKKGIETLTAEQKESIPEKRKQGEAALAIMDDHLSTRKFFVADKLTVADVALYAYAHVSPQGGFDLSKFPNVQAWCERITQQPGYIALD
ncbi:hypothetical protein PRZ48_007715 [Zasmidium cellare]|uniref:Glutathione S-transferase n=1 Tax=Zasmidium cellare TaxID=395010 RepID=A0ABR0EL74_ZASCE|nr:hypothetical protein PRZ48_007715 [Zasmidium cellare]